MMMPQPAVTTMTMGQMPAATSTMVTAPMMMQEPVPSGTFATGMSQAIMPGQQLVVEVVRAIGLHHMNHFTGDHPYVQCEVKHLDRHARTTRATTTPVTMGDTLNPVWGEKLELQPWQPGEDLEFTVYDKGLIGAKTEGRVLLPSHMFYPNGFNGSLEISGLPGALLQIVVQPAGAAAGTYSMTGTSGGVTYSSPAAYSAGPPTSGMTYSSSIAPPATTFSAGTPTLPASPVTTMIGSSATYGAAQTAMPVQTFSAPTAYSTSTPVYTGAAPTFSTMSAMAVPTQTYAAQTVSPAQTYASPQTQTVLEPVQANMMGGGQVYGADGAYGVGAYKLAITIMQAQNLKHMNNLTADKPYVVCEVKHNSHHEKRARVQTKEVTIGDALNPQWNEYLELEPWHPGENLEFTIYDKGLLGSRTEARAELQGEMFFTNPNGWTGALPMANNPQMLLYVAVRLLGPSAISSYRR